MKKGKKFETTSHYLMYVVVLGLITFAYSGCNDDYCGGDCNDEITNLPIEGVDKPSVVASASDRSTETSCAEEDNINISFVANLPSFRIEATHPTYDIEQDNCAANFTSCPAPESGYQFTPKTIKLFDDGKTVVEAVREAEWWLPNGMETSVDEAGKETNIHYIRVYRKIAGINEWPQILVLYMDGNMRLIPHPSEGESSVCFGSSVVIGPANASDRPYAEIRYVHYVSASDQIEVWYVAGGKSIIHLTQVNRSSSIVTVTVDYPTNVPFATFRSMFIENGNSDVDTVDWIDETKNQYTHAIREFTGGDGVEWFFYRSEKSIHNTSAPNIKITTQ